MPLRRTLESRSSYRRCSVKKVFLKILEYSQENRKTVLESLFNKAPGLACNFIKKRLQHSDVLLWNLRNIKEHLFWRTSPVAPSRNPCFFIGKLNKLTRSDFHTRLSSISTLKNTIYLQNILVVSKNILFSSW